MADKRTDGERTVFVSDYTSASGSSLLPMLVGGLLLIVIAMIAVMVLF